jgi:hypothetical protein
MANKRLVKLFALVNKHLLAKHDGREGQVIQSNSRMRQMLQSFFLIDPIIRTSSISGSWVRKLEEVLEQRVMGLIQSNLGHREVDDAKLPPFARIIMKDVSKQQLLLEARALGQSLTSELRPAFFEQITNLFVTTTDSLRIARKYGECKSRESCRFLKLQLEGVFKSVVNETRSVRKLPLDSASRLPMAMLNARLSQMTNKFYRAVLATPDFFGIYSLAILQVVAASVFVLYFGVVLLVCLFVIKNLTAHAQPYLVLVCVLLVQGLCRLLSGIFSLTGSGPQFIIPNLVPKILSDMVAVLACVAMWGFLYLWGNAYHATVESRPFISRVLLCSFIGVSLVTFGATLAETLLMYLPRSPLLGSVPYIGGPLVYSFLMFGSIGMVMYSILLLRHLKFRLGSEPSKDVRYRRVREMLVCSLLMTVFFAVCFGLMVFVAVNRFDLMLADKYYLYRGVAYAVGEILFALSMCYMMGSLLLGDWLSQGCGSGKNQLVKFGHSWMRQSLLEHPDDADVEILIPDLYDV